MKNYKNKIPVLMLLLLMITKLYGQRVTEEEAIQVAGNWVSLIQLYEGNWVNSENPFVGRVEKLVINNRDVGYYCQVIPLGSVMVSLYKCLAPVKAYSTDGWFNLDDNNDPSNILKECMEEIIIALEDKVGPIEEASENEIKEALEINYSTAWNLLNVDAEAFKKQINNGVWDNYQASDILLSTAWNQNWPYNMYAPEDPECIEGGYQGHVPTGCGPICAAQVMKYWNWPPFWDDPYDWKLMPRSLHNPPDPPQNQVEETAELIDEIGEEMNWWWGCSGSLSWLVGEKPSMINTFQSQFQYSEDAMVSYRSSHSADGWWDIIKEHINLNRPMPYQIMYHFIVADGWQEIGNPVIRQYHMNWGHGDGCWDPDCILPKNSWYSLDELPNGSWAIEATLTKIYPKCSIGPLIDGNFFKEPVPYRYFDEDAAGIFAVFHPGQKIQFLQNIVIFGAGFEPTQKIVFFGEESDPTLMFSQGDQSKGIIIRDASLRLRAGGSIQFKRYNY